MVERRYDATLKVRMYDAKFSLTKTRTVRLL